jgi:hypothetical protein
MARSKAPPRALPALSRQRRQALVILREALEAALEVGRPSRDFALELSRLQELGVSDTTLRWLLHQRYVEHLWETTKAGRRRRRFRKVPYGHFSSASCFVLSPGGAAQARHLGAAGSPSKRAAKKRGRKKTRRQKIPHYDAAASPRVLTYDGKVVKEYRRPAPNQALVLASFEELGWPPRIDDPLPPVPGMDSKQRLHDTIDSLNRRHKHRLIRFFADGTGRGVCWRRLTSSDRSPTQRR